MSSTDPDLALVDAIAAWTPVPPLPPLTSPRRVVLLGRRAVGKTTLRNLLCEAQDPTGLGGVTAATDARADGSGFVWVDTPGIDDPRRALIQLAPALEDAHGVVWVVDGLQPVTHSELTALQQLLPSGLPVWVVVSRADLVPADELDAVCERVRRRAAPFHVVALRPAALRRSPDLGWLRRPHPTPAELSLRADALASLIEPLRAARPLDADELRRELRVGPLVRAWLDELAAGDPTAQHLLQRAHHDLQREVDHAIARWRADPQLRVATRRLGALPPVPEPDVDALHRVTGGVSAAWSALSRQVASWALEVDSRLDDLVADTPLDPTPRRDHDALERALLDRVAALRLSPASSAPPPG